MQVFAWSLQPSSTSAHARGLQTRGPHTPYAHICPPYAPCVTPHDSAWAPYHYSCIIACPSLCPPPRTILALHVVENALCSPLLHSRRTTPCGSLCGCVHHDPSIWQRPRLPSTRISSIPHTDGACRVQTQDVPIDPHHHPTHPRPATDRPT